MNILRAASLGPRVQFYWFLKKNRVYIIDMCLKSLDMSTCTTVVHIFQNLICTATFCCSLSHAFSPYVHDRCNVVNSHLLITNFRFATVKSKTMLLNFLYLCISNI